MSYRHVARAPIWTNKGHVSAAAGALAAVVFAKFLLLLLDPQIRLFMGDSATYLFSAVSHATPPDRSFTYPMLIGETAGRSGSLVSLLLAQTVFGIAAALCLHFTLRTAFGVRGWLAALAAAALAVEPSQLFYERMVMTETTSSLCLLGCVTLTLAYLRDGRLLWLLACAMLGTVVASLRVGLVPVALCLAPLAPLLVALLRGRSGVPTPGHARLAIHFLVAVLATGICHHEYKIWYGARTASAPAYLLDAGVFRLGLVVPLLKPEHFAGTGVSPAILDEVRIPLANPHNREAHIWTPGGLISVLREHAGLRTREVAAMLAEHAIHDDPMGLVSLGIVTFAEYFDPWQRSERLHSDIGYGEPPGEQTLALLRERFHYEAAGVARTPTPILRYFEQGALWLVICLFALLPLALTMLHLQWRVRPAPALLLALLAAGMVIGEFLCAHIISFRYLHPLPMLFLICLAATVDRLLPRHARALEMRWPA
ncbi:hypothetical protein [Dokdonella soli]|uniref:Glycosyltransferase RgtA/B/C/D-like domain-containing protein n=1 Tax=Dokdonella soli TaxID=529810 RepID=A0ABN1IV25_9GAMM